MQLKKPAKVVRDSNCERGKLCPECKGEMVKFHTGNFYYNSEDKLVFKLCWKCRCGNAYYSEDGGRDAPPRLKRAAQLVIG